MVVIEVVGVKYHSYLQGLNNEVDYNEDEEAKLNPVDCVLYKDEAD
jgi:hypothetical protein